MRLLSVLGAGLLACSTAGCGAADQSVTRVVQGREIRGRYISTEAYSAYLRGAYLETHGDRIGAQAAYEHALQEDPDAIHTRTRLGALLCRARPALAIRHFARAEALDPDYPPLWRERGRCELERGRLERAATALERAMELDPLHLETPLLLSRVRQRQGRPRAARRQLAALVARFPDSRTVWQARLELAHAQNDAGAERVARRRLERLHQSTGRRPDLAAIDAALAAEQLDRARSLAHAARIDGGELALRAAALGRVGLAREQATRVLGADPDDGDAWVAALVGADLLGDPAAFAEAVAALGRRPIAPGPLGARLLAELLRRRLGQAAARAWLDGYGPLPTPADPLERSVATR